MIVRNLFFLALCAVGAMAPFFAHSSAAVNQNTIPVNYRLMDQSTFQKVVVGQTIVGVTSNSKSLYLLYFAKDGSCDLWKQNLVYPGTWWIEKDELGRDFMRAFWPGYAKSSNSNPKDEATSIWYYVDPQQADTLIVATKNERSPVLLVPGRAFPSP